MCARKIPRACLIAVGLALTTPTIAPALGGGWSWPGTAPSWTPIDQLVQDIDAYLARCGNDEAGQATTTAQCATDKADLLQRQKKLGVSDALINGRLKSALGAQMRQWP